MARFIYKHRRGTTAQWEQKSDIVLYDGEMAVEHCEDGKDRLKIGDGVTPWKDLKYMSLPSYATEQYVEDKLVTQVITKTKTISLSKDGWTGELSPYSQVVNIDGVTNNSKIDLQPDAELLAYFQDEEIALVVSNNDGVVTVHAIGYKPTIDITIQCTVTEVITE